ncbi:MAG: peroxidase family protein [Pseudomonadota bacterium]
MSAVNLARRLGMFGVLALSCGVSAFAQENAGRYSDNARRGPDIPSARPDATFDPRNRVGDFAGPGYSSSLRLSTDGVPYLTDTNGRKCMGFGRLFPIENGHAEHHPTARTQRAKARAYRKLAKTMVEPDTDDIGSDSEMPAGYTFLAQFIDHDITFDTISMLNRPIRDDEFRNARSVALDLDSVYGGGPEEDPYLYNLPYLRVGKKISGCGSTARFDLLRVAKSNRPGPRGGAARALIGDPRNDENFVTSQLHSAFVAFHNRIVDLLLERRLATGGYRDCGDFDNCNARRLAKSLPRRDKHELFELARKHVIHYYHRIIIEDFLPRIIGEARLQDILRNGRSFFFPDGFDRHGEASTKPFIPVEFAVAAFRYGHSQVRERYQLRRGVRSRILDVTRRDGVGRPAFQPIRRKQLVDWRYFFPIERHRPRGFNYARRIDTEIAPFLHHLGRPRVVGRHDVTALPARNLIRGQAFRLPSGQAIASIMLPALERRGILTRYDTTNGGHDTHDWASFILKPGQRTRDILGSDETPLWYYILEEAAVFGGPTHFESNARTTARSSRALQLRHTSLDRASRHRQPSSPDHATSYSDHRLGGHTLGPVGATLVGEVLVGLIEHARTKSNNGLDFRPIIRASISRNGSTPLSLTAMPHINRQYHGRYLMRNLLIDADQAAPVHGKHGHVGRCDRDDNAYQPIGDDDLVPPIDDAAVRRDYDFEKPPRRAYRFTPRKDRTWQKGVFRVD